MSSPTTVYHFKTIERIARSLISTGNFKSMVDLLGDATGASRCMLLKVDAAELVAESEYASPDVGPLDSRRFKMPAKTDAAGLSAALSDNVSRVYALGNPLQAILTFHGPVSEDVGTLVGPLTSYLEAALQAPSEDLTRQVAIERALRTFVSRINVTLDRNYILQTAVDAVGHMIKADACLFARAGSPNVVTHEYIRSAFSPLGLGGTSHLPEDLFARFAQQTGVALAPGPEPVDDDETRSWLGTPVLVGRDYYGSLIVQDGERRRWQKQEIEIIELAAHAVSSALANAITYEVVKDQLFNMKLANQLTSQLTVALEQASKMEGSGAKAEPRTVPVLPLSNREMEVLRLIAGGLANREIAQRLFLTESTVELHASRIRKKLKLKSRTALVKFACDNNVV